jgi:hypothetical protein
MSSPLQKEVHYFDNKYYRNLRWYSKFFPQVSGNDEEKKKTFETSPYYLSHPAVPKRVAESLPDVKLVAVFRDPVDRAVSQYKWMRQIGLETRTAEEAFRRDADRLELAADSEYLAQFKNPLHFDSEHIYRSYLRRSLYHVQLKRWFEYFAPSQIRVVNSRTLFEKTRVVLEELSSFLKVKMEVGKKANSVNQNSSSDAIPVSDRAREIAQKSLEGVREEVEEIVSEEMVVGKDLLLP